MTAPAGPAARLTGLDGLRALAAGLIVVHHAGFLSGVTLDGGAGRFTGRADVGVAVFFVLSGFLLATPFARAILDGTPRPGAAGFLRRRAVRIFPAYWLALAVMLAFGGIAVGGAGGFAWTASLLHIYDPDRVLGGITQSWSLATEVAFYGLLVLAAALAPRALGARATVDRRARLLLAACVAAYLASLGFRFTVHRLDPSWATTSSIWFPALADHFALGIALAVLRAWADLRPALDRTLTAVGSRTATWWVAAAAAYAIAATQLDLSVRFAVVGFDREVLRQFLYGVVGLALVAPIALAPTTSGVLRRTLERPAVVYLGTISYGIYLWHVFFMLWLLRWTSWDEFDASFPGLLLGGLALAVVAAALSHRLVEAPLQRRFGSGSATRRRPVAATPPAAAALDP